MSQEQKKQAIAQYCVTKGIIAPADIDAEISKMAGACPDATAKEKGLATDLDKAYEVMLIQQGGAPAANPTTTTAVTSQPAQAVSSEEALNIAKTLIAQQKDRANVSANSSIEKYIFDRPDPKDYIKAGTKGIISAATWKAIEDKWGSKVLPDDTDAEGDNAIKSTTNFNILKEAAKNGTPVDINIGKLNTKPIGYVINKGTAVNSGNVPEVMTREQAETFLVLDTAGYILSSDTKPGLKLRYIKGRPHPKKPGEVIPPKSVLADANKQNAIDANSYDISKEATAEVKSTSCKTELAFKVDTGVKKRNGNGNITRIVRVTCKADIPVLTRKAQYVDIFKDNDSNANLDSIPDGKLAENITEAQQLAIAKLRAKAVDPSSLASVASFVDKLKAFDVTSGAPQPNVQM